MSRVSYDVVVVGAGFGGLSLAKQLRGSDLDLLMIDRNNYHTFQPLLYQVATSGLGPEHLAHSVRDIFQSQSNFHFRMDTVRNVDFEDRSVQPAGNSPLEYEYLVLAAGASANYFGIEGAREHAFPMKNLSNAVHLRGHILERFERAESNPELIEDGEVLPQLAPVAIQQGAHTARQIENLRKNESPESFVYDDPGQMATIGRHAAVVELSGGFKLKGYFAWLIWVFLHVAKLIGFQNKLMVFVTWVYNYFTYGSSSRLILDVDREHDLVDPEDGKN